MHVFRTVNGLDFPNVTKKRTLNKQSKKLPEKKNKTTKKFQHSRLSQYPELAVSILGRLAIAANKLITSMWSVCRSSLAVGRRPFGAAPGALPAATGPQHEHLSQNSQTRYCQEWQQWHIQTIDMRFRSLNGFCLVIAFGSGG